MRKIMFILLQICILFACSQTHSKSSGFTWNFPLDLRSRAQCMEKAFLTFEEFRKPRIPWTAEREHKVHAYFQKWAVDVVRQTHALEEIWRLHVDVAYLYEELKRMIRHSSRPDQLRRIWEKLHYDPYLILECFVRPFVVTSLIRTYYATDIATHKQQKEDIRALMKTLPAQSMDEIHTWAKKHADAFIIKTYVLCTDMECIPQPDEFLLEEQGRNRMLSRFKHENSPVGQRDSLYGAYRMTDIQETDTAFSINILFEKTETRMTIGVLVWSKPSFERWWNKVAYHFPSTLEAKSFPLELPELPEAGCQLDTWQPVTTTNAPTARAYATAVWTGAEMIVWGGDGPGTYENTGGRYYPATDSWLPTSTTNAPTGRALHTAVWTGSEMIIWGGVSTTGYTNTGGRYDPVTDSWSSTSLTNAPSGRNYHTAIWTGSEMIVWGGYGCADPPTCSYSDDLETGGEYHPSTDSWSPTPLAGAPSKRRYHTAVWTGGHMIIWGGLGCDSSTSCTTSLYLNSGAYYDKTTDSWSPLNSTSAPSERGLHEAIWSGQTMIAWGGRNDTIYLSDGSRYDPANDSWSVMSSTNAPTGRGYFRSGWSGSIMIIWGGYGCKDTSCTTIGFLNTGGQYDPSTDIWTPTSVVNAPSARRFFASVIADSEFIVWGGLNTDYLNDGGRYCVPTGTTTVPPVPDKGRINGEPLRVQKQGTNLLLTWDVLNCTSTNYNILYGFGPLSSPLTPSGATCILGTTGSYIWTPPTPPAGEILTWFLVVGFDGFTVEGTWGFDSNGNHRSTSASGFCSTATIDTTTAC